MVEVGSSCNSCSSAIVKCTLCGGGGGDGGNCDGQDKSQYNHYEHHNRFTADSDKYPQCLCVRCLSLFLANFLNVLFHCSL